MMGLNVDLLGFGLTGTRGLGNLRDVPGNGRIRDLASRACGPPRSSLDAADPSGSSWRIPGIGGPLQTLALSRLAWTLHLTMNTSMDVRRSLALSLRSTQNARYIDQIPIIDAEIVGATPFTSRSRGRRISGGVSRHPGRRRAERQDCRVDGILAKQYQDRARMAMTALARRGRRRGDDA